MKYIKIPIFILLGMLPLLLTGCTAEEDPEVPTSEEDKVRFELFARAGSYELPETRALADEDAIDRTPWVLVFLGTNENASFVEAVQAEIINGKSYVYLSKQDSNCQLLILANPENTFRCGGNIYSFSATDFKAALNGQSLTYAYENILSIPLDDPQTSIPFVGSKLPMSDLVSVSQIDVTINLPSINLKRTVGKVIVKNSASNFELLGITAVVHTPKQARLYNLDNSLSYNTGSTKITEYAITGYATDIAPVATSESTENNPLYLYESECGETLNNTYLIIRGIYDNEEVFYKMAFINDNGNQLDIQRNYEYTFTITTANSRGFESVADAKRSKASNKDLDYVIRVQDNSGYEIIANNDYYMGVTNSHFELYASTGTGQSYVAFSIISDCKISFAKRTVTSLNSNLEIISPTDGIIPVSTSDSCDVAIKVNTGFTEGEIEVHLGNLKKTITVRRQDPINSGDIISEFMPSSSGTYLSAYIVDYPMNSDGTPSTSHWMRLAPGGQEVRNDPHRIYVDNGLIDIHTYGTEEKEGDVYISTKGGTIQRIKLHVAIIP